MLFNSFEFLFAFLPITLIGFYVIAHFLGKNASLFWLVLTSLVFYGYWNPSYVPLILALLCFNYAVGYLLGKDTNQSRRKLILAVGIVTDLGILGYYKYANFLVDQVNAVSTANWQIPHIILPLAISFFTFQKIAYLVDAYRNETKEYSFLHFSLFVTFFPQLIAGPIVHHKEIMPQFDKQDSYTWNPRNIFIGLSIFAVGLFKKTIFADNAAHIANAIFSNSGQMTFFDAWIGALSYSLQLYFDFSGYSDMAVGAAYMFGIRLPINFDSPYKSTSIIDFWRRWHMTLSRFLRDYLYFSLGGSKKGEFRRYLNLFITMLLGGIWHGAGWTFIIWGALHGSYLVINHAWRSIRTNILKVTQQPKFIEATSYRVLTLLAVVVGWVYFRANTVSQANYIISTMMGLHGVSVPAELEHMLGELSGRLAALGLTYNGLTAIEGFHPEDMLVVILPLIAIALFCPNSNQIAAKLESIDTFKGPYAARLLPVSIAILLYVAISTFMSVSQFLYFNF